MKLRNRYILLNTAASIILGTILKIAGLDKFMDENIPIDLSIGILPAISLIIALYGLWRITEVKSFSAKDKKLYVFVSLLLVFTFGLYVSELLILPFYFFYCQNNIC